MILCESHKSLFVSNPKAATHSMYSHLMEHYDGRAMHGPHGGAHFHPLPEMGLNLSYWTWTIVRNPYSRAVALWWRSIAIPPHADTYRPLVRSTKFFEFCKWLARRSWETLSAKAFIPQAERMADIDFDAIVHIEHFTDEFGELPFVNGDSPHLPTLHASQYGDYRDWYDATGAAAAYVRQWAAIDFDTYGYSTELDLTGRPTE